MLFLIEDNSLFTGGGKKDYSDKVIANSSCYDESTNKTRVSSNLTELEANWETSASSPIDEIVVLNKLIDIKGKNVTRNLYEKRVFTIANTSEVLQNKGLLGEQLTIKYGTISRHYKKDEDHTLSESEWRLLPSALLDPTIKVQQYNNQYRIWTNLTRDNKQLVVAVDVIRDRKGVYHNSIKSLFFKNKT